MRTTFFLADLRALGYCNDGARTWFKSHGLPWSTFVKEGLPVAQLDGIVDPMARAVVEQVNNGK